MNKKLQNMYIIDNMHQQDGCLSINLGLQRLQNFELLISAFISNLRGNEEGQILITF